ncbi:nucleoside-diphosphate kinase [Rhizobium multihospitium]|uniref:Nucleoside diphosphate kinase n=1 Tax=Rhizobium multihospitium TaxID=410764 RepID=A0A1C3XB21_9HYPH|nr:nucleoside-diphosphate kinase [Rhizobium multihospitium]SCB49487.1 nucleoside diphosphate kinase [Rhizobium multihospitium]
MTDAHFWKDHVLVLMTPDIMVRGLQLQLFKRLLEEGIIPVAAKLSKTDAEMIDELYRDVIAGNWQTWRYRLIEDAFALAPSLAMICRCVDQDLPHAYVKSRKGNQHPHLMIDGQIRRDFGAINAVLGIFHASDNPEESRKDALVFGLTPDDVFDDEAKCHRRIEQLCKLTTPLVPETRDFDDALQQLRAAILTLFWDDLDDDSRNEIDTMLVLNGGLAATGAGSRLANLVRDTMPNDLFDVLQYDFTPEAERSGRLSGILNCIKRYGIEMDSWQHLVLESSCYFPPARKR